MVNRPWHTLTWNKAPGKLTTEELQDGCCGSHRGYHNKMFLAILNLHVTPMPSTKFCLNLSYLAGADEFWRFQDDHLRGPSQILDQTVLVILNLYVTPMPPIKFGLNPHYGLGGDGFKRISRGPLGGQLGCRNEMNLAVWINMSPPKPRTKFQRKPTPIQSKCHFKIFNLATMAAIFDIGMEPI